MKPDGIQTADPEIVAENCGQKILCIPSIAVLACRRSVCGRIVCVRERVCVCKCVRERESVCA